MFAFPLFLLADSIDRGHGLALVAAWCFTACGVAFSYFAALEYLPLARTALRDGRHPDRDARRPRAEGLAR